MTKPITNEQLTGSLNLPKLPTSTGLDAFSPPVLSGGLESGPSETALFNPETHQFNLSGTSSGTSTGSMLGSKGAAIGAGVGLLTDIISYGINKHATDKANKDKMRALSRERRRSIVRQDQEERWAKSMQTTQLGFQLEDREMAKERMKKQDRIDKYNRFMAALNNKIQTNNTLKAQFIENYRGF
jgi:hypothetical protein